MVRIKSPFTLSDHCHFSTIKNVILRLILKKFILQLSKTIVFHKYLTFSYHVVLKVDKFYSVNRKLQVLKGN